MVKLNGMEGQMETKESCQARNRGKECKKQKRNNRRGLGKKCLRFEQLSSKVFNRDY